MNITLETLIWISGFVQLGIVIGAVWVPKIMNWRVLLGTLHPFMRHLFWVYAAFIMGVNLSFAGVSIALPAALAAGTPLAHGMCGIIAFYWGARLMVQLFLFDVRPLVKGRLAMAGYHGLTVAFTWLVVVYTTAAFWPQEGIR